MRRWIDNATSWRLGRRICASRSHWHGRNFTALAEKHFSTSESAQTILTIPKADVYQFGDANKASPVFKDLEWTIRDGESWAIVGPAGNEKTQLLEVREVHTCDFMAPNLSPHADAIRIHALAPLSSWWYVSVSFQQRGGPAFERLARLVHRAEGGRRRVRGLYGALRRRAG